MPSLFTCSIDKKTARSKSILTKHSNLYGQFKSHPKAPFM